MCNIDEIMDLLNWQNSVEEQNKGIELAKNIKSLNVFIQPCNQYHGKDVWENCAKIIDVNSDETLNFYLYQLFEWLEDINWPGAIIILERLKRFTKVERFATVFSVLVNKNAKGENKLPKWVFVELLENEKLKAALDSHVIDIIE